MSSKVIRKLMAVLIMVMCSLTSCVKTAIVSDAPEKTYSTLRSVTAGPAYGNTAEDYLFGFSWGGLSEAYETMPRMIAEVCDEFEIPQALSASPITWSQEEQNACIDGLIASGATGMLVMPSEPDRGSRKIAELYEKGVPTVCLGGSLPSDAEDVLTLAPDVYQYSYDATIALLESMNYRGRIIALTGAATDSDSEKKIQAVEDVCNQYYHATLLQAYKGIDSGESAEQMVKDILEDRGNEIDGVVALDYYAAHVMASYLMKDNEYAHIKCIGLDTDELVLQAIREGRMLGTVSQNPMAQAYLGIMTLKMIKDGWRYKDSQPDYVNTGNYLITGENVDEYEELGRRETYRMASTWTDRFDPPAQEKIDEKKRNSGSQKRVSVIIPESADGYWDLMEDGIRSNIPGNISVRYVRSQESNDQELVEKIETAVASNVDVIVTCACDNEEFREILNKARYKGTDVILVESDVPDGSGYCYIGIDNYKAGTRAAKAMVIVTRGSGRVSIIGGKEELNSQKERIRGFKDTIRYFSNMRVICEEYSEADPTSVDSLTEYILKTHPETTVFLVTSPSDADAVNTIIQSRSNKDIYSVVTFETAASGTKDADAVIAIDPVSIGEAVAEALTEAIDTGTAARSREVGCVTIINR